MENVILNTLMKENQDKGKEVIQKDLKNNTDSNSQTEPRVFLVHFPFISHWNLMARNFSA